VEAERHAPALLAWHAACSDRGQEVFMATMCPIDGCRKKKGMCIHDKLMVVMGGMMVLLAGAHWGLHLF
jgi:hypothetical protein